MPENETDPVATGFIQRINVATSKIATKLQTALESEKNNLSPESVAAFDEAIKTLEAFGADASNPIPNESETEGTSTEQSA